MQRIDTLLQPQFQPMEVATGTCLVDPSQNKITAFAESGQSFV